MATQLSALFNLVLPFVKGVSDPAAETALLRSAIEFCKKTGCDRVTLDAFPTVYGDPEYSLATPSSSKSIDTVRAVFLDSDLVPLEPVRDDMEPGTLAPAKPTSYMFKPSTKSLVLFSPPDGIYSVKAKVVLIPSITAQTIDDWINETHGEAIARGAIYRLASMPKAEWSDPNLAMSYKVLFDQDIAAAKGDADKGNTTAPTRTRGCFGMR